MTGVPDRPEPGVAHVAGRRSDRSEGAARPGAMSSRIRLEGPTSPGQPTTDLVLGHSGDAASVHALSVAADLAHRLQARLHVVHGVDLADFPADPDAADWEQQARRSLDRQYREVEAATAGLVQSWTYHASRGDPVSLVIDVAEEHDALMIIVGTRGEGFGATIGRLVGRSVSHGVIHRQRRPVLVVPPLAES